MSNEASGSDYTNAHRGFGVLLVIVGVGLLVVATGAIPVANS